MTTPVPAQSPPASKDAAPFALGPDQAMGLLQARSYFLVPLLSEAKARRAELQRQQARLTEWVQTSKIAFTDIYVVSHGWHRNFFDAVAAYDKLFSRFTALFARGRLRPSAASVQASDPAGVRVGTEQDYRPLFIAFHWNSDPECDGWLDRAGRRTKTSFIANTQELFEPSDGTSEGLFLNTLEDLYEYMTFRSVGPSPAFSAGAPPPATGIGPIANRDSTLLKELATHCGVRGGLNQNGSDAADKAALLWRCYDEATAQRVLVDQGEQAQPFQNPLETVFNLLKFLVAVLGIGLVVSLVSKAAQLLSPASAHGAGGLGSILAARVVGWFSAVPLFGPHVVGLWTDLTNAWHILSIGERVAIGWGLGWLILLTVMGWNQQLRRGQGGRGLPVLAVASWLPLQILHICPLLLYLFLTSLLGTWFALAFAAIAAGSAVECHVGRLPISQALHWDAAAFGILTAVSCLRRFWPPLGGLFVERPSRWRSSWRLRYGLAWLARWPLRAAHRAVARDSQVVDVLTALDNQLAFWEMQSLAVDCAQEAGVWLNSLLGALESIPGQLKPGKLRLHLVGHSFGGLLVANAARSFCHAGARKIHSLTLLQAALSSDWFRNEAWASQQISGALACVFSAYDMANGFYYPTSCNSRMAAGYVGLCQSNLPGLVSLGKGGLFASLVQPPRLDLYIPVQAPHYLNLDASELIFAGSPALGGGHDDIFKDDVIHMIWAITQL